MTQVALGELIGSDGPRVGRLEKGVENPTVETLDKIAAALTIDVHLLTAPRPEEESGHAERREGHPVLDELARALDAEVPAEDTWQGDVLKAIAALNRALRRPADGEAAVSTTKTGR